MGGTLSKGSLAHINETAWNICSPGELGGHLE
jgi:hypothetical protein